MKKKLLKAGGVILLVAALASGACVARFVYGYGKSVDDITYENMSKADYRVLYRYVTKNMEDYVTLGKYEGIEFSKATVEVTDEDVEERIEEDLLKISMPEVILDRKAKEGDKINIDFEGSFEGKKVDDISATDFSLTIGSNTLLSELENCMTGEMPGTTKNITVTFPKNYSGTEMDGNKVDFEVTFNYIEGEYGPSQLNKFFARKMGCESVEDYQAAIRSELELDAAFEEAGMENAEVKEKVLANFKAKDKLKKQIDKELAAFKKDFDAKDNKEELLAGIGKTEEEYYASVKENLMNNALYKYGFTQIALKEKQTISYEDFKIRLESYKDVGTNQGYDSDEAYLLEKGPDILRDMLAKKGLNYCVKAGKCIE